MDEVFNSGVLKFVIKQKYKDEPKLSNFDTLNVIGKCLIYKSNPQWFYECDSSKIAVNIYDKTGQGHRKNRYDTLTSWLDFSKAFLGFCYNDGINKIQKNYESFCEKLAVNADSYETWTKNRIRSTYPGISEEKVTEAYSSFLLFSESVYSIGNVIPVGYSPKPIRRNDRWDCKIQWIYDVCVVDKEKDAIEKRHNEWKEFLGETTWKDYIDMYFLQDFVGEQYEIIEPKNFPTKLSDWIIFFDDTSKRVKKRENRIYSKF